MRHINHEIATAAMAFFSQLQHRTIIFFLLLVVLSLASHRTGRLRYLKLPRTTTVKPVDDISNSTSTTKWITTPHNSMRACMIVRDDNYRLQEWLAYHYTILPLRHIIVGSDVNSTENPMDVLSRWNGTDLQFQVWHADDFLNNFKYHSASPSRHFVERQAHFYLRCMQHFHAEHNLGWLALTDTDEYIKLNPLDDENDMNYFPPGQPITNQVDNRTSFMNQLRFLGNETLWDRVLERKRLRTILGLDHSHAEDVTRNAEIPTVLEVLENYSHQHMTKPCLTMARLQYTAVMDNVTTLANLTCRPTVDQSIASSMNITELTTMRYLYHYNPDSFMRNRWGKVLVDLRRIPPESILKLKQYHNPHAPLGECGRPPAVVDVISFLRVNHYLQDFTVYTGRKDDPRNTVRSDGNRKVVWSLAAHGRDRITCDHMAAWVNEFVHHFGIEKAKFILGQE